MLRHHRQEFVGQSDFLERQRSAVGLVFVALQQQVQQPVVGVRGTGGGKVEQVAGLRVGIAMDGDFDAEFGALDPPLVDAALVEGIEGLGPLLFRVVPEHQPVALEDVTEAVVDAVHGSKLAKGGGSWEGSALATMAFQSR